MTTARSFTATPDVRDEPVELKFDGTTLRDKQPWSVTLLSVLAVPGAVLDSIVGLVRQNAETGAFELNRAQAVPILRQLIREEDHPALNDLLTDRDRAVDYKTLWDATTWLVEEMAKRPSGGSITSPDGV